MADSFTSNVNNPNDNRPQFPPQPFFTENTLPSFQNHNIFPSSSSHTSPPQFHPSTDHYQFPTSAFVPPLPSPQVHPQQPQPTPHSQSSDPQFDIFDWFPKYQSCQRYFIDHAQQAAPVQAVAAFINIQLPLQRPQNPITSSQARLPPSPGGLSSLNFGSSARSPGAAPASNLAFTSVSLIPYLRRLVVTGLDFPGVLHGFFGDDWASGVGPLHEQERRNYLFAAKSGGWASVKKDYDMGPAETVPFMRPLQGAVGQEIEAAERTWSEWLAMEDWMVGPRAPEGMQGQQQSGGGSVQEVQNQGQGQGHGQGQGQAQGQGQGQQSERSGEDVRVQ
ncbi:MAG: hypothetical protein Q9223_005198 [Gallowayella weberi]